MPKSKTPARAIAGNSSWLSKLFPRATSKNHLEALKEIAINGAVSTVSIWLGALLLTFMAAENTYSKSIWLLISKAELTLISLAFFGPIIYILTKERRNREQISFFWLIFCLLLVMGILNGAIFLLQKVQDKPIPPGFTWLTIVLYILSVSILYYVLVYSNSLPPDAGGQFTQETASFTLDYEAHRKNQSRKGKKHARS